MGATFDRSIGEGSVRRTRTVAGQLRPTRDFSGPLLTLGVLLAFMSMGLAIMVVPDKPELVLVGAAGMLVMLAVVRWPVLGVYIAVALALLTDTLPSPYVHTPFGDLGLFRNLSSRGLPDAVIVSPFEILLALAVCSTLVRRFHNHQKLVHGPLFGPVVAFGSIVAFGTLNGLVSGGDFKISMWEVRSLFYIVGLYVLTVNTINKPEQIRIVLWLTALGVGARCLEGIYRQAVIAREVSVVLEHDDSLFLVLPFGLLVAAVIWRRWLSKAFFLLTLALIPASFYVMVINNRRAAFLCLFLTIAAVMPLVWICLRSRSQQKVFIATLVVGAVIGAGYLGAFWNRSGGIAEPAQAVKSAFQPDERDSSSNMYRELENINLRYTIGRSPVSTLMGIGFGRPMDVIVEVVNLEGSWSWQFFMPHNNMLWLWLRMGIFGFMIFWIMIGMSVLLAISAIRLGVLHLRSLAAGELQNAGNEPETAPMPSTDMVTRGTGRTQMGLIRYTPKVEQRYETRVERAGKPSPRSARLEMRECAEMLVVAALAVTTVTSLIGITIVDQGLMSFRIAAYTGVILGTLGAAWNMYYTRYRLPAAAAAEPLPQQEELPRAQRRRVRYLVRP